ncbi:class I SAM-dependent methyltransferase [Kinneretia aquatilis]|uniref:class I SAM-dependent methyltransferase n=1 Tax=Kinneretia aquatilis TaxID=2070761 RepID=UPI001CBDCBDF|nr:methyltransferase domain-containing protein [Paucibacter aquatile]WIV99872.1 methyltransferase domain-containing protein [Paucibacter aquatile]
MSEKAVNEAGALIKVHLGCWHRVIPGFVHVDLCDMPHIDHKSGIDALPFLADNSASLIYCSHALEYFDRDQAREVLKEWRRVLAPGGVLRLAVPDFQALIQVYQQTGELARVLGPLYGKMAIQTEQGPATLYHKTTYDQASLSTLLEACGFVAPERWDWRQTEHAAVDDHSQAYFPHMQKDTGILVSLNLQARKPT